MRRRVEEARIARLATVGDDGRPHLVPITFAVEGDTLYFTVDAKPKRTRNLQRLRNIASNPAVAVLLDHYEDDWSRLWWVRLDGTAHILEPGPQTDHALEMLGRRYAQYRHQSPGGPVVAISIARMSGWSAA